MLRFHLQSIELLPCIQPESRNQFWGAIYSLICACSACFVTIVLSTTKLRLSRIPMQIHIVHRRGLLHALLLQCLGHRKLGIIEEQGQDCPRLSWEMITHSLQQVAAQNVIRHAQAKVTTTKAKEVDFQPTSRVGHHLAHHLAAGWSVTQLENQDPKIWVGSRTLANVFPMPSTHLKLRDFTACHPCPKES